jgi:hypothetical protein
MPFTPQNIYETQQASGFRLLLRASNGIHGRIETLDRIRWIVAVILAASATLGALYPDARGTISALGFTFALLSTVLWTRIRSGLTKNATVIQEQFDTELFGLPWSRALPPKHSIVYLSRWAHRAPELDTRPWYVDVTGIPSPVAEAICQRENVLWDSDLRKAWMAFCKVTFTLLASCLLITGLALHLSLWNFLLWIVFPTSSLLGAALTGFYDQASAVNERKKVLTEIDRHLANMSLDSPEDAIKTLEEDLRFWQDDIYRSRVSNARVPSWFFRLSRERDERDHGEEVSTFRLRWSTSSASSPGKVVE